MGNRSQQRPHDLNPKTNPFLTSNNNTSRLIEVVSLVLPGRLSSKRTDVERDENLHYHPVRAGNNNTINAYEKQIIDDQKSRAPAQEALRRLCKPLRVFILPSPPPR